MPSPFDSISTSNKFHTPETGEVSWDKLESTALERIIESQHGFVKFLQNLHVSDESIHYPPEGGWPEISTDSFKAMGKSDCAIEILRNMAYIEGSFDSGPREILIETALIDYRDPDFVKDVTAGHVRERLWPAEPPDQSTPQDVVCLTIGGIDCKLILLDCKFGIVRWVDCGEGHTSFGAITKGDPSGEGDDRWAGDTAWPVEEFFEYIKSKFINMEQLSYNQHRLIRKNYDPCGVFETIREIYQKHGWPGGGYRKDECMEELVAYCTEHRLNQYYGRLTRLSDS